MTGPGTPSQPPPSLPGKTWTAADLTDTAEHWPAGRVRVAPGRVAAYVTDVITAPSGATMERDYLVHPGAVGIIALDDAGRIAIVQQYRHPAGARLVEAPAGLLDHPGEDMWAAARRELAEEARLSAATWRTLLDLTSSPGISSERIRVFLARDLAPVPAPVGFTAEDEEADMGIGWARVADVLDAIYAGRLHNPTIVMGTLALQAARLADRLDSLRAPDCPWTV